MEQIPCEVDSAEAQAYLRARKNYAGQPRRDRHYEERPPLRGRRVLHARQRILGGACGEAMRGGQLLQKTRYSALRFKRGAG